MLRDIHKKIFLTILLFCGWTVATYAQPTQPQLLELETVINESLTWTIENTSNYNINISGGPSHGSVESWGPANNYGEHTLVYTPDFGFVGRDELIVKFKTGGFWGYWVEQQVDIIVLPAYIKAIDDFAATKEGEEIIIDVLANDDWTGSDAPHVEKVTLVNSGTADCTDASCATVSFTPENGFTGLAHLNYTICDDDGNCDDAIVNISVSPTVETQHEDLSIITSRETSKVVLFDLAGYELSTAPQHGSASIDDVLGIPTYLPSQSYTGYDNFSYEKYENGMQYTRNVSVHVLDVAPANKYLLDDNAYTEVGHPVLIDFSENDKLTLGSYNLHTGPENGTINTAVVGGEIQYEYIPNAGFSGVDQFKYWGYIQQESSGELATVTVHVDNQIPAQPLFELNAVRGVPLVIEYAVPIDAFTFSLVGSGAEHGQVELDQGYAEKNWNGQSTTGYNLVTYTIPESSSATYDEFEIQYQITNSPNTATTVKLAINILDMSSAEQMCIGDNCVWPGDTNRDGIVDVKDVLPIGLCMGEEGVSRNSATLGGTWYGQYAEDWNDPFEVSDFDLKHIDTDGDSIVSNLDTAAIAANYGMVNSIVSGAQAPSDLPLYFENPNPGVVYEPGDLVSLNIYLGKFGQNAEIAKGIHGLTASLPYSLDFVEENSVNISFPTDTWMSYDAPTLGFVYDLPNQSKVDFAYTRTNGVAVDGYGLIAQVEFVIIEEIFDTRPEEDVYMTLPFTLTGGSVLSGTGQSYSLAGSEIDIQIHIPAEKEQEVTPADLRVFPNPSSEVVNLYLNGYGNSLATYEIYDITGRLVQTQEVAAKSATLSVADWNAGTYLVRVTAESGEVINKKFEVVK